MGDVVDVVQEFRSNSETPVTLLPGSRGEVQRIDEVGDLVIKFQRFAVKQWVRRKNFAFLKKAEASLAFTDGFLTLADGRQLYVNVDGWVAVSEAGQQNNSNADNARRVWTIHDGLITLADGRQLYANPDGWVCAAQPGQVSTSNTDDARRVWRIRDGFVTLADGRQLYAHLHGGWAGVAQAGESNTTNNEDARRVWTMTH